jgi:septum formation protein
MTQPEGAPTQPPRLRLASTSAQRRAILEQLRIPFEVVVPSYVEHDPPDADPVALVRAHAEGKARSVHAGDAITLGVDTTVHLDGRLYGKAADADHAARTLHELSGRTHSVLSGVCLLGSGFTRIEHAVTDVTFRDLTDGDVATYLASGEWEGRAGAYAIQGLGGRLVGRIDGATSTSWGFPGHSSSTCSNAMHPGCWRCRRPRRTASRLRVASVAARRPTARTAPRARRGTRPGCDRRSPPRRAARTSRSRDAARAHSSAHPLHLGRRTRRTRGTACG